MGGGARRGGSAERLLCARRGAGAKEEAVLKPRSLCPALLDLTFILLTYVY